MSGSLFPALLQVNTRVWLTHLSHRLGRNATLDDIPDKELDEVAAGGFEWIWLLSIWQTGKEGQRISRANQGWRKEFEETLPDLKESDIAGSGFAITGYTVSDQLGGDQALARLRKRLSKRGLKLMLDFVPNHAAIDHPWVSDHTDFFVQGDELNLLREPDNYLRISRKKGDVIIAHGRDPFFPGWPDTVQYNYGNPALQEALTGELMKIAGQCDGVRCDMAMLVLPEVFEKTWGIKCQSFWPEAIRRTRDINPQFLFMAEVYWDMEWTMLQQGFDYAYDKRLYDRLKEGHARPVREHLYAGIDYQSHMVRFLENHDEPRAAATFTEEMHQAAAAITFLSPGLRFFHQGQFQGKKKRISPHLVRGPEEPVNEGLETFYSLLMGIIQTNLLRSGNWQLHECLPAWAGNHSNDNFLAFSWQGDGEGKMLVTVNYSGERSQCYIRLPFHDLGNDKWTLTDLISGISYEREGDAMQAIGLYLDEPEWKVYVFSVGISRS